MDSPEPTKRGRGRPPVLPDGSLVVTVKLTPQQLAELGALKARLGPKASLADAVRARLDGRDSIEIPPGGIERERAGG